MLAMAITLWCLARTGTMAAANIVVFLADDHGALDSEVYGSRHVRTPNMVRLAKEGMTLTRAFVASPSCAPSRASLLTGLMPARHGAEANHARPGKEIKKLPAYLQALGYEVVAFGKVSHYRHTGDYGFDHFAHDTFHDHAAITAAVKWLRERKSEKPLCLLVGSNWPHVPWPKEAATDGLAADALPARQIATPEILRARKAYFAAVEKMDQELGTVYETAREVLGTNLLFIHTSDHGAQFPFAKWNCYDAGIRTSFLAVWPGVIKPGAVSDAMVSWIDLLPTMVEAGGGMVPAELDGKSFLPALAGKRSGHRDVVFATHSADGDMNVYPMRALRTAEWKYIRNLRPEFRFTTHIDLAHKNEQRPGYWGGYWESWTAAAVTSAGAAQILKSYHERPAEELYDLRSDPDEKRNLASDAAQGGRLMEFRAQMDAWMAAQSDKSAVFGAPKLIKDP